MNRVKVLAISYLFPNREQPNHGVFVLNRLKALSRYVDITVINPIPWSPVHRYLKRYEAYKNLPEIDQIEGITVYHPRYFSIPRYLKGQEGRFYLNALRPVITQLHKTFAFDLIDMHWTFPDLPAGVVLAKEYGVPSIVTLRGMEAFHFQDNDERQNLVTKGLQNVDYVIALSEELKEYGDKATANKTKSIVVRNGVDTDAFHYLPMNTSRERLGLAQDEKVIVSVGSLIYRKGFDVLIKALKKLKQLSSLSNTQVYIIGSEGAEGDYREALYNLVNELDLNEHVIFVGQVPNSQLKIWYNAADVFCLASRGEGSPNVLTEALACGCPAVTTDVGSAKEIVESEPDLGSCIPVDDEDNLASSLEIWINKMVDRSQRSKDFSRYDWDWCAQQVLPVYNSILSKEKKITVRDVCIDNDKEFS